MSDIGDIISTTFKRYSADFKLFTLLALLLYVLPQTVISVLNYFAKSAMIQSVGGNATSGVLVAGSLGLFGLSFFVSLIKWVLYIVLIFTIIKVLLMKKKQAQNITVGDAIKNGAQDIGSGLGLSILMGLAIFGLFLLLIIPGIIFAVYWMFAMYILVSENVDPVEAMKRSKALVKGRWWKVFGYDLVFSIMVFGIVLIPSIMISVSSVFIVDVALKSLVSEILSSVLNLFTVPLTIVFMEQFYLALKQEPVSQ